MQRGAVGGGHLGKPACSHPPARHVIFRSQDRSPELVMLLLNPCVTFQFLSITGITPPVNSLPPWLPTAVVAKSRRVRTVVCRACSA